MIFLLRPPGVPQVTWQQLRHCWTKFAEGHAHAVVELPFSDESIAWIEEQACRSPNTVHVSVAGNFIPFVRFWDELDYLLSMGKRAVAEEVTDLVYRRNRMEPDLEPKQEPGRAVRVYCGKAPQGRRWWKKKYSYQYLLPLYWDGDPAAPGYKCALGRILPVFWPGWDFPSGRAIYGDGATYDKVQAAVRWDWIVNDFNEHFTKGGRSIFFG